MFLTPKVDLEIDLQGFLVEKTRKKNEKIKEYQQILTKIVDTK
jgi:hypothetical protein